MRVQTPIRGRHLMKRLIALFAAAGALALAACDDPRRNDELPDVTPPPADQAAPTAEETAAPAVATAAPPPADSTTLPSEKRTSEESVKPDSDTLFY